jgi:hypothetical protein
VTSARWQQLDRMFIEALQLSPETRGEYVDRTCGADKALRTEALALLAYADESGDFLAQPALERLAQVVATDGSSLRPGERVGRYTVVQRLGSGGSGEVWRASDERLGRDVAIKVLFPHLSTDTDRLRRFAEEARAAGALNHSNIVTVHEVGEHHGMPFLVSECLEGHSLRECLDAGAIPVDH